MATLKNKKTTVSVGSSQPAEATLAGAKAVATTSFKCLLTVINGWESSRPEESDNEVFCESDESIKASDTGEIVVSKLVLEGLVNDEEEKGYIAVKALCDAMFEADTQGTVVLGEANGTDFLWGEVKVLTCTLVRGGPQEKQKFKIEFVARTKPKAA